MVTQECLGVAVFGRLHVVVEVAVAQVAKVHQPNAWDGLLQQCIGRCHKLGDARNRNRNVVLDVQAFLGLRHRNALADVPQVGGLREVFSDHGIADAALIKGGFKQTLELRARMAFRFVVRVFQ